LPRLSQKFERFLWEFEDEVFVYKRNAPLLTSINDDQVSRKIVLSNIQQFPLWLFDTGKYIRSLLILPTNHCFKDTSVAFYQ
jgi:hypothetical protein